MDEANRQSESVHTSPGINEGASRPNLTPVEAAQRIEESLRKAFEGGVFRLSKTAISQRVEKAYGPEIGPLVSAGLKILADKGVVKESDPTPRERMAYGPIHCDKFFEIEGKIIDATKSDDNTDTMKAAQSIDFKQIEGLLVSAAGSLEILADAVKRLITTDKELFIEMRSVVWVRLHESSAYLVPLLKIRDDIRLFLPVCYPVKTPLSSPTTFELFIKFVQQCDYVIKTFGVPDENFPEMLGESKALLLFLDCVEFKDRHQAITFAQTEIRIAEREYVASKKRSEPVRQKTSADGDQGDIEIVEGVTLSDAAVNGNGRPKGVSLRDAALLLSDNESTAATDAAKRWRNFRDPKLPDPIGNDCRKSQAYLYQLDALADFIEIVETTAAANLCRQKLRKMCRSPRN